MKRYAAIFLAFLLAMGCATSRGHNQVIKIVVQKDDSLNSLADKYDTDWRVIVAMNRADLSDGIREGQELFIKPGPDAPGLKQREELSDEILAGDDQGPDEEMDFLAKRKKGLLDGPKVTEPGILIFPVEGRISSKFGKRGRRHHKGIDLVANTGTPIVSAGDGEVIFSGRQRGYGLTVVVDHGQFMTLYAHASKLIARNGDRVRQGDFIAKVGRTGNARGVHLHFELRNSENKPIDPLPYLHHKTVAQSRQAFSPKKSVAWQKNSSSSKPKTAKIRRGKKGLLYARD